jgi:hypothetical protein
LRNHFVTLPGLLTGEGFADQGIELGLHSFALCDQGIAYALRFHARGLHGAGDEHPYDANDQQEH